jgi:16S rRNA processing protein RimM
MTTKKASKNKVSGSPPPGEPEYLVVGSLRRPHGLHGEMVMEVLTDFPERLKPGAQVYLGDAHRSMTIAGARFHNEGLLVKFEGIELPEEAGRYRNQLVYVTRADRPPLPTGHFYHHELIGFAILHEDGRPLGTLTGILQTGANDVYVVARPDASEVLLPNIPSVILAVDADRRLMRVRLIPGLLDESED